MRTFVIQCENLIIERGEIEVEANTAEEALAMAKDSDDRQWINYWFTDTVGSIDRVVRIDKCSYEDVEDSSDYKGSIQVDDYTYLAPYSHVALAEIIKRN